MDLTALQVMLSTLVPFLIGVALFWLALYIFSRWSRDRALRLLALTSGLVCMYFFYAGLTRTANTPEAAALWIRLLWPAVPFAPVVWLNMVLELDQGATASLRWRRLTYAILYPLAGGLAAAAILTEWIFRYSAIYRLPLFPWEGYEAPSGDGYYAMPVFLGGVLGLAAWRLFALKRQAEVVAQSHFRRMVAGTIVAAIGAVYLALDQLLATSLPEWFGECIMTAGVFLAIYAAISYRTTLRIRHDFFQSMIRTAVVSTLYLIAVLVGLLLQQTYSWALLFVVLSLLVVVTHTMYDMAAAWIDRVLRVPPDLGRERERSRRFYRSILFSDQATLDLRTWSDEKLYKELRHAVSHVKDLHILSLSPLTRLYLVTARLIEGQLDPTPTNRAVILQQLLLELIGGLRSGGAVAERTAMPSPMTAEISLCFETLFYKYAYVGEPPADVAKRLKNMPERTLYRWQKRGCKLMAATLRYLENLARISLLGEEAAETGGAMADIGSNVY